VITVELSDDEDTVLSHLAEIKGLTKLEVMQLALCWYQLIEHHRSIGNHISFLNKRNEPMQNVEIDVGKTLCLHDWEKSKCVEVSPVNPMLRTGGVKYMYICSKCGAVK